MYKFFTRFSRLQHRHSRTTITSASLATNAHSCFLSLSQWIKKCGGAVHSITVKHFPTSGDGLAATRDISAGEELIILPRHTQLTYSNITPLDHDHQQHPALIKLIDKVPPSLWGGKLALQLLSQRVKGEDSRFKYYVESLPATIPRLPMFYNGAALAAFDYPIVTEQVKKRCRWLLSFTQDNLTPLSNNNSYSINTIEANNNNSNYRSDPFNGSVVDANALGWALGVVMSRAFRTGGPSCPASMLPLIDMANHSFTPNAKVRALHSNNNNNTNTYMKGSSRGVALAMVALKDIKVEEEITLSYGNLSNDFLLMDYGFIVAENPHDTVVLQFSVELVEAAQAVAGVVNSPDGIDIDIDGGTGGGAGKLPGWKKNLLIALGLMGGNAATMALDLQVNIRKGECPVDARLLAALRVLNATSAKDIDNSYTQGLGAWDQPLNVKNEMMVLKTLTGVVAIALSSFKTTFDQDVELLAGLGSGDGDDDEEEEVNMNMRLAIHFRMAKKKLLLEALQTVRKRIAEVGGKISKNNGKGFG